MKIYKRVKQSNTFFNIDNVFTEEELRKSFHSWQRQMGLLEVNNAIEHLLHVEVPRTESWLQLARQASKLSLEQVAKKLKVSRQAYHSMEKKEMRHKLTIGDLKDAAEALDCELVYFLRPKNRKLFSQQIWEKILEICKNRPNLGKGARRYISIAALGTKIFRDPDFRRENNLSERLES